MRRKSANAKRHFRFKSELKKKSTYFRKCFLVAQRTRTAKCARWAKKQAVRGAGVGFTQTKVKRKAVNAKRVFSVQIRVKKRKALTFVSAFLVAQRARTGKCARWAKKQAVRGAGVGFTQTKVKRKSANAKRAFSVQIRVKKEKHLLL